MGGVHGDPQGTATMTEAAAMRIRLEKRIEPSRLMLALTPIASVALTMIARRDHLRS